MGQLAFTPYRPLGSVYLGRRYLAAVYQLGPSQFRVAEVKVGLCRQLEAMLEVLSPLIGDLLAHKGPKLSKSLVAYQPHPLSQDVLDGP